MPTHKTIHPTLPALITTSARGLKRRPRARETSWKTRSLATISGVPRCAKRGRGRRRTGIRAKKWNVASLSLTHIHTHVYVYVHKHAFQNIRTHPIEPIIREDLRRNPRQLPKSLLSRAVNFCPPLSAAAARRFCSEALRERRTSGNERAGSTKVSRSRKVLERAPVI